MAVGRDKEVAVVTDESAVGRTGVVVVATRGAAGPGEVLVKVRGGTEAFLARSDDPLAVGTPVLVIESLGVRTLLVVEWYDPTISS